MTALEVSEDLTGLDAALETVPNSPAVFLLWPKEGVKELEIRNEKEPPEGYLILRRLISLPRGNQSASILKNGPAN